MLKKKLDITTRVGLFPLGTVQPPNIQFEVDHSYPHIYFKFNEQFQLQKDSKIEDEVKALKIHCFEKQYYAVLLGTFCFEIQQMRVLMDQKCTKYREILSWIKMKHFLFFNSYLTKGECICIWSTGNRFLLLVLQLRL